MNRRTLLQAAIGLLAGRVAAQPTLNRAEPAAEHTQWDRLLDAIEQVESGGKADAVGDGGRAVGAYQIHKIYVDDCNIIAGKKVWTYADRLDRAESRDMVRTYLMFWGRQYEKRTGLPATAQVLARMHVSGPNGWQKKASLPYWQKVRQAMEGRP